MYRFLIAHHSFPEHKVTSKPKDLLFTVIRDEEKQQLLMFKKVEPARTQHFYLKMH